MKLGTLRNGRPDGQLVVIATDLSRYASAGRVAPNLQAALDNWDAVRPALEELAGALNAGGIAGAPFDPSEALAPLPRTYQRIGGAAYPVRLERPRSPGANAAVPAERRALFYQGASDGLGAPMQSFVVPDGDLSPDFSAEIAVVLGPVPMRPGREEAAAAIRLVTLACELSLRKLAADDLEQGFGYFLSKPTIAFAPAALTPDELGSAWRGQRVFMPVRVLLNNMLFGQPNAGIDMHFDFAELIMAAARTRPLGTGTILSAGTISNRHEETPPIRREGIGFAAIAEARVVEKAKYGRARTPFLKDGDRIRVAAFDAAERPVFGTIDQTVSVRTRN
ncbi:MAG: fumarylacetoacetate hydrolase family protein [Devosia sp.]|nr:fumarylacetoacetate hydrolase family protein [Devosia sp.]